MRKTYTLGHVRGEKGRKLLKRFDKAVARNGFTRIEVLTVFMEQYPYRFIPDLVIVKGKNGKVTEIKKTKSITKDGFSVGLSSQI